MVAVNRIAGARPVPIYEMEPRPTCTDGAIKPDDPAHDHIWRQTQLSAYPTVAQHNKSLRWMRRVAKAADGKRGQPYSQTQRVRPLVLHRTHWHRTEHYLIMWWWSTKTFALLVPVPVSLRKDFRLSLNSVCLKRHTGTFGYKIINIFKPCLRLKFANKK